MNKPDLFKAAAESHVPAGPGLVKAGLLKHAISFVRDFTAYAGIAGARAAALAVIAATFDGVGLLLLVPMLSIVTGTEAGNTHPLLTRAFDVLDAQTRAARITLILAMFVVLVVVRAVAVARRNINLSRLQADYVRNDPGGSPRPSSVTSAFVIIVRTPRNVPGAMVRLRCRTPASLAPVDDDLRCNENQRRSELHHVVRRGLRSGLYRRSSDASRAHAINAIPPAMA